MWNVINSAEVLSARIAYLLEEPTAFEEFANTEYEWELAEQGDQVTVQNFPVVEWNVVTWTDSVQKKAWEDIPEKDWALGKSKIIVKEVANINLKIKNIEKAISNLNLEQWLEYATAQWNRRVRSRYIRDLALAKAKNQVGTSAAKITVTETNVFKTIMSVGVKIDNENAPSMWRALFASPDLCAIMTDSRSFDNTNISEVMRKEGYVWRFAGFTIIKDTTLPAGVAVAMDKNSVHFIKKLTEMKFVWSEHNNKNFSGNLLGEMVYGGDVLELNKWRICKLHYEVA